MQHRPTLQHPQPGHNQELLGLTLCSGTLPMFESDGGQAHFPWAKISAA